MERLSRKEKSDLNRSIYSVAQAFSRRASQVLIDQGADDVTVVIKASRTADGLDWVISGDEVAVAPVVSQPVHADEFEPY